MKKFKAKIYEVDDKKVNGQNLSCHIITDMRSSKYVTHKQLDEKLKPIIENMVTHKQLDEKLKPIVDKLDNMVTHKQLDEKLKPITDKLNNVVTHKELDEKLKPIINGFNELKQLILSR